MKRGFIFYVGFLLLVIFGAALVGLVVLFCSPGKEILGFTYYSYSDKIVCETTSDDSKTPLELGTLKKYSEVQINADYAKVELSHSKKYEKNAIIIINNAKGFTLAKDAVDFDYSVLVENGVLKVSVTEPQGFLAFSKDIKIIVHIADKEADPFVNTNFTIKTGSGSIELGGAVKSASDYDISVGQLLLETKSGLISITPRVNGDEDRKTQTFSQLAMHTGSGKFTASVERINVLGKATLLANNGGKYSFDELAVLGETFIKTAGGTYKMHMLSCLLNPLMVECANGYFYIDEILGDVKFPCADVNIDSPKFKSDKIYGDFTVVAGNGMNVEIGDITGSANIVTKNGSVTIGKGENTGLGGVATIKTESGKIVAYVKGGNDSVKEFTTENGEVQLYLLGQVLSSTTVNTKNGNVKVKFETGKAYTISFTYQTKTDAYDLGKVKFVDYPNVEMKNPFVYTEDSAVRGLIEIHTDANVELSLFATK